MNQVEALDELVVDQPDRGLFKVHRAIFTRQDIFDLELAYIFERSWVFLGFEDQLPRPYDYLTTFVGRQPVLVTRGGDGILRGFLNSCRHKGTRLAAHECGNAKLFVCPYHAWTYAADGRLRGIKDREAGAYDPAFAAENHDLLPLAAFGNYRGLIFGSLGAGVPTLEDYLGGTRALIDLIMDQGEHGMELVPGRTVYTYDGNWKLQLENGMDPYHLTSAHRSFIEIVSQRKAAGSAMSEVRSRDFTRSTEAEAGALAFEHGHGAVWIDNQTPEQKPIFEDIKTIRNRVGDVRSEWMLKFRNLVLFPNVQLADSESLILRVIRPLSVNSTEMRLFSLAPIGEAAHLRARRIRQHEDFFNVSGLATPDDTTIYEEGQAGLAAGAIGYQRGYDRGATQLRDGADAAARTAHITSSASLTGPFRLQSEMQYRPLYREWKRLMTPALAGSTS